MANLELKRQELEEFLEEQGYTVSQSFSLEPQGTLFADIHKTQIPFNNNLAVYQSLNTLEVDLMAIVTPETEQTILTTVKLLADEYAVIKNTLTDNTLNITLRGNFYD